MSITNGWTLLAVALALCTAPESRAGDPEFDIEAALNMVLAPPSYAGCGDPLYDFDNMALTCGDLTSTTPGGFQALWIIASHPRDGWPNGIGGIQFGWEHVDLTIAGSWTLCTGGSEIPQNTGGTWPESGTGNAVTWPGGCYVSAGDNARIGFITLSDSAQGAVQLTGDPRLADPDGAALFTNCSAEPFRISSANLQGSVLADGLQPLCPTPPIPTRTVGWSRLKRLY